MSERLAWTNSKKDIYYAYKEILNKYESLLKNPPTSKQAQREKAREEQIVLKAKKTEPEELAESVLGLKADLVKTLDRLSEEMRNEAQKLSEIQQAKVIETANLEKISDAKISAEAIEEWINHHERSKSELEATLNMDKNKLEEDIEAQRLAWEEERATYEKKNKEYQLENKLQREKNESEYTYALDLQKKRDNDSRIQLSKEFEREMKLKRNKLEDEIALAKAEFEREKDEINKLRERANSWDEELLNVQIQAQKQTEQQLQSKYEREIEALKLQAASAAEISSVRIASLETYLEKQETRIEEMSSKLEKETGRVHEIANKAVEGASGSAAFQAVNRIAVEQAKFRNPADPSGEKRR